MVVASSTDFSKALASPASVVQDLFEQQQKQSSSSSSSSLRAPSSTEFVRSVQTHFEHLFSDAEARAKIPALSGELLREYFKAERSTRSTRLIRWRCMIQDTSLGDEVTPYRLRTADGSWKSALFGGANDVVMAEDVDLEPGNMAALTTMYGVSLPGQTEWYRRQVEQPGLSQEAEALLRRGDQKSTLPLSETHLTSSKEKLPTKEGFGALLKLYDEDLAEALRVTKVVDLIGILDEGASPTSDWADTGAPAASHAQDDSTSTSANQPAIHVLSLSSVAKLQTATSSSSLQKQSDEAADREALLGSLTESLGGDRLAAEWVLLAMLAKIHTRKSANVLGSLSLNLSHVPAPASSSTSSGQSSIRTPLTFSNLVSTLLPLSVHQSMSLSHLNDPSNAFAPSSASSGGLEAGRLQLVDGTFVLLDETSMDEGQLRQPGIDNIRTLSTVLQTKKLPYSFPFSTQVEMDVDLRFVVVSQGKSFLPVDVQVPLECREPSRLYVDGSSDDAFAVASGSGKLDGLRSYLVRAQERVMGISIPEAISEKIQDDFVESRSQKKTSGDISSPAKVEQEDLVRRLNVARLIAASRGSDTVEWDCYLEAKRLDEQRQQRVARLQPPAASTSASATTTKAT